MGKNICLYWETNSWRFVQFANITKNLRVLTNSLFTPSIHYKKTTSEARRLLFMVGRTFAQLSMSVFTVHSSALVQSHVENIVCANW